MSDTPLRLFNSLTRQLEEFQPVHPGVPGMPGKEPEARVYTCGPTVYNYQHVGNMRAYVFADTLGRVLSFKGYKLNHVINITDVGHLTSDADAGDDKMEKAAAAAGQSAWDIARHYQQVFEADLARLNVRKVQHPRATDYVEQMITWAETIAPQNCYELDSGLYFDVSTVPEYGRLAREVTDEGQSRIDPVAGKRHPADFAIWRKTPPSESRQMEWPSPWGMGAPGWHIECSVMSAALLGQPFDIHTGGIDHREIHHPCEIAQNQAHSHSADSGARIWMHNNFLIDRRGKMSKSSGDFLTLQALVDRGYHPMAFRMMCLQAHYRSELEFSWEGLGAALVRLKRLVMGVSGLIKKLEDPTIPKIGLRWDTWPIKDDRLAELMAKFGLAIGDDLNTSVALTVLEDAVTLKNVDVREKLSAIDEIDDVLGLGLGDYELDRSEFRIRPKSATITEPEIDAILAQRKEARAAKDFATSDALRDELAAKGVEVMDGDPLGWDWKLGDA